MAVSLHCSSIPLEGNQKSFLSSFYLRQFEIIEGATQSNLVTCNLGAADFPPIYGHNVVFNLVDPIPNIIQEKWIYPCLSRKQLKMEDLKQSACERERGRDRNSVLNYPSCTSPFDLLLWASETEPKGITGTATRKAIGLLRGSCCPVLVTYKMGKILTQLHLTD